MRRTHLKILQIVNIIVMVVLMLIFWKQEIILPFICIGSIVISIVLAYLLRCPYCGRWPKKGDEWNGYCPRCGEKYED